MEAVSSYAAMGCGPCIVSANAIRPADNSPFGGHWCLTRKVLLCLCPGPTVLDSGRLYHNNRLHKTQEKNKTIPGVLLNFIWLFGPPTPL